MEAEALFVVEPPGCLDPGKPLLLPGRVLATLEKGHPGRHGRIFLDFDALLGDFVYPYYWQAGYVT